MRIRAGYRIVYDTPATTPMLMMLSVRPERARDLETPDWMQTEPYVPIRTYVDSFGNICTRLVAPAGRTTFHTDFVIRDSGEMDVVPYSARQEPIDELPDHVVTYLLPSRYCDVELLSDLAWRQFGPTPLGWPRVQAVLDYAHNRIRFGYEHARATKTAHQAHEEGAGVCRDYAHLAITLCRALNIPARYCTGYLGDIGVPAMDAPMDFAAWFEVYLGGEWHTFDARNNTPRIGRVLIARGRDAADVAITTTFGPNTLESFRVWTDEVVSAHA